MHTVITIGREFGSGGRELGRRLAEELGFDYYDKEIIAAIAAKTSLSQDYIRQVMEDRPRPLYPITVGQTFYFAANQYYFSQEQSVHIAQSEIIRELAERSNCVIVGRCADHILRELKPYRIFVYADMDSKIRRCMERSADGEALTEDKARRQILSVDKNRAKYYSDYTGKKWGHRSNYDLLINTTDADIKDLVPHIAKML